MQGARHLRVITTSQSFNGTTIWRQRASSRSFASIAQDDSKLPLKGYKVLDMTRVLAGVSTVRIKSLKYANVAL